LTSETLVEKKKSTAETPTYAWVILFVTMLAGVTTTINQFKVPPVLPVLMEKFQMDLSSAGLLMSIFAITGLVMALPAGVILQKMGARFSGLVATGSMLLGAVLGALSSSSDLLLFSRLVEGVGMGLIAVVAPAVIASWFPPQKRGLPMGIWATWVSLGSLIIYNLAPALNATGGWHAVWWGGAIFAALAFCCYWLLIRVPPAAGDPGQTGVASNPGLNLFQALANRNIWLLAFSFGCFTFVVLGVVATYFPTFLKTERGYSLADASLVTSLKMAMVILMSPVMGRLSDRIGSRRRIILISCLALAAFMLLPFSASGWLIPASMVILGILAGSVPMATFSAAPEIMGDPRSAGLGMAVVMIGQNLGILVGPLVFSALVQSVGWQAAGWWMIVVILAGFGAAWLAKFR
jgi:predicted MFS family arabinose efflux permease